MGGHICDTPRSGRMVMHPPAEFLGRRFESWSVDVGGSAATILAAPGFQPPTKKSAAVCITIRPLPMPRSVGLPTAWTRVCH